MVRLRPSINSRTLVPSEVEGRSPLALSEVEVLTTENRLPVYRQVDLPAGIEVILKRIDFPIPC